MIPPEVFESEYPLPRFENVAAEAGVDYYALAGGAVLDDFDNDGRLDLMVSSSGLLDQARLYWNGGDGAFEDRTHEAGLTGEVGGLNMIQADYDNDGFVDVLILRGGWMGSEGRFPMSLLRNDGDGTFTDVTRAAGLLRLAPTQTADHWLTLELEGVRSNRKGIGARIEVVLETCSGRRSLHRTVGSGGSFGASPLRQEIGLGDARRIESVEVFWPATGETQTLRGLELDRRYRVREGVDGATPLGSPPAPEEVSTNR